MRGTVLGMIISLLLGFSTVSFGAVQSTSEYRPNEVIVKYKAGVRRNRALMEGIYDVANVIKVKRFKGSLRQFEQLILNQQQDVKQAIADLEKNPSVEYAQPNYILRALPIATQSNEVRRNSNGDPCWFPGFPPGCDDSPAEPGEPGNPGGGRPAVADKPAEVNPPVADPMLDKAYGISKIGSPDAWRVTKGSQDMVVAVIDTGVDYNHEDLSFNMWRNPNPQNNDIVGWDFIHNDNLPFDDNQHGTHCAGVIGAVGGNGKGISGVNQRVSIMALKFLSGEGSGDTAGAIKAIDYAVQHGAKVLSNSWGGPGDEDNKALLDAILRAEAKDVLFVAAAGNDSANIDTSPTFPAAFEASNMLTVAATDSNDGVAYFSNTGVKHVHLAAPGVSVYSSVPGNSYASLSGTSMACPHAAGAAALLWSKNPTMTYKDVKARLMETVDKLPVLDGKTVTGGRLNIAKALSR